MANGCCQKQNKNKYIDALHETDVVVGPTPSAGAHAKISQIKRFAKYFNGLVEKELKYYIDFATETSEKYGGMTEVKLFSEVNLVINYFMPCKKIHT